MGEPIWGADMQVLVYLCDIWINCLYLWFLKAFVIF